MSAPETMLDPVCDMIVNVADARDAGLTLERPEREYAFCAAGCQMRFAKSPASYIPKVEAWLAARTGSGEPTPHAHDSEPLAIDAGVRAWYKSCRCCLSDAHPEIVEALDKEKSTLS